MWGSVHYDTKIIWCKHRNRPIKSCVHFVCINKPLATLSSTVLCISSSQQNSGEVDANLNGLIYFGGHFQDPKFSPSVTLFVRFYGELESKCTNQSHNVAMLNINFCKLLIFISVKWAEMQSNLGNLVTQSFNENWSKWHIFCICSILIIA